MPTIKTQTEFDIPDEEFERGIVNALRKLPDFVMVVRCENCIHHEIGWCNLLDTGMNYNDFCSLGERREENAAD